uniref:ComF family protein n=1 Tax=candidate division WOR-3 bacterium TaxID=2052148 RepID=A0A7C4U681_UNCW3
MNIFKGIFDFFFPPLCHICDRRLSSKEIVVCERCFSKIIPASNHDKILKKLKYLDDIKGYGIYSFPLDEIIHLFKYYGRISLSKKLGMFLEIVYNTYYSREKIEFIVPVPLHPTRKRERGYNQSLLLSKELSNRIKIPVSLNLKRIRYTTTQTLLSEKDREKNIKNAFKSKGSFKGTILLIDDVSTTGHTLDDCARALKEAGAERVISLVVATAS